MSYTTRQVELDRYPTTRLQASDFRVNEVDVPDLELGQVLVRNTWTSVDPGMRLRLGASGPRGYFQPFPLHAALDGIMTVGVVVESRTPGFVAGDTVSHALGWRELSVVDAGVAALGGLGTLTVLDTTVAPAKSFLGVLGAAGITAYVGLVHAGELHTGDVVWVSAAAGAVGSLVAQFAKLRGHVVIASAGSDDKVAYLRDELGVDAAFNYRSGRVADLLRDAAPDGIDLYFDNVGGDHLEAALSALRRWGRVALCGAIADYESAAERVGPRNLFEATANDLTLRGFRGSSYLHLRDEVDREVGALMRDGRLHYPETAYDGLESAPRAMVDMLAGDTVGKTLVHIAD
ncbi:MAG: NADP-dependent oxidoreductase [Acidimicrobiales bacterium]